MHADFRGVVPARSGHFRYESGYHSTLWLDLDGLFVSAAAVEPLVARLTEKLARYDLQGVCGPLVGGAFLAQWLAAGLGVEFYYAERFAPAAPTGLYAVQYRIPASLQPRLAGKRIAIVDDVISAGSAVRGAFNSLQSCQAIPVVIGALLVLGSAAQEFFAPHGISVEALEQRDQAMWPPAECPLCARGVPLEDLTPDRDV